MSQGDSQARRNSLKRIFFWTGSLLLLLVILCTASYGFRKVFFVQNPYFIIRNIEIHTTKNFSEDSVRQILADLGVQKGKTNLMVLDTRRIRQRLEKAIIVERARVIRRLPDTLVISILQRVAVAKLHCRPQRFIDDQGYILPWWESGGIGFLPEITGVRNPSRLRPGKPVQERPLLGALRFLSLIGTRPEGVSFDIATIQLDYELPSIYVYLRERDAFAANARIRIPVEKMPAALDRLRDIVRLRLEDGHKTHFADVTYERNVPLE